MEIHRYVLFQLSFKPVQHLKDCLNFSFVKDIHVLDKQSARNGQKMAIYQSQILGIRL